MKYSTFCKRVIKQYELELSDTASDYSKKHVFVCACAQDVYAKLSLATQNLALSLQYKRLIEKYKAQISRKIRGQTTVTAYLQSNGYSASPEDHVSFRRNMMKEILSQALFAEQVQEEVTAVKKELPSKFNLK